MANVDKYLRTKPQLSLALWVIPTALIVVSAAFTLRSVAVARQVLLVESNTDAVARRSYRSTIVVKPSPRQAQWERQWDDLKREREFAWGVLFGAIEQADRPDVELLELRSDKRTKFLVLHGEARDADALAAYIADLARQDAFSTAHVTKMEQRNHGIIKTVMFDAQVSFY